MRTRRRIRPPGDLRDHAAWTGRVEIAENVIEQTAEGLIPVSAGDPNQRLVLDPGPRPELVPTVCDESIDKVRCGLDVELESNSGRAQLERLVFARLTAGQVYGSGRQVERLPVPVEHVRRGGEAEDVAATAGIDRFDGEPADFGFGVGGTLTMTLAPSPFAASGGWLNHALEHLPMANAMALATAAPDGEPARLGAVPLAGVQPSDSNPR